jgi:hypothetical protein
MGFRKLIVPGWIARKEQRQAQQQTAEAQRVARPPVGDSRDEGVQRVTNPLLRHDPMRKAMRGIVPTRSRLALAAIGNGRVRRGEAKRYRHPQERRRAREARLQR